MIVNTDKHTLQVDFINRIYSVDGNVEIVQGEMAETYYSEHLSILKNDGKGVCSLKEGIRTVYAIEAAKKAVLLKSWINKNE